MINIKHDHSAFESQKAFKPKLCPHTRPIASWATVLGCSRWVFQTWWAIVSVSAIPVIVRGVCYWALQCSNAGVAKQSGERLQLSLWLVGWPASESTPLWVLWPGSLQGQPPNPALYCVSAGTRVGKTVSSDRTLRPVSLGGNIHHPERPSAVEAQLWLHTTVCCLWCDSLS
jgi:hypothetical protein